MLDMNIKLGQSTNPITNMFQAELNVCKQQHTPTANKNVFSMFLSISQTP